MVVSAPAAWWSRPRACSISPQECGVLPPHRGQGRRKIEDNKTTYCTISHRLENPVVGLATPRTAWCRCDLGDPDPSKPSALSVPRTLSRARKITVTTVIAGRGYCSSNYRYNPVVLRLFFVVPAQGAPMRTSAHPLGLFARQFSHKGKGHEGIDTRVSSKTGNV